MDLWAESADHLIYSGLAQQLITKSVCSNVAVPLKQRMVHPVRPPDDLSVRLDLTLPILTFCSY